MDKNNIFNKYYSRLAREGMLKASFIGLIVGFAIDFIFAFVTWFLVDYFDLWCILALLTGLVTGAIVAVVTYYKFFIPTTKMMAKRIDALGLEERLITMTELENDPSYIALRQREDARTKLSEVNSKMLRLYVARGLIVAVAIISVLGLSMTTVNALTQAGIIDKPQDIFNPNAQRADMYFLEYGVDDEMIGKIVVDGESYSSYSQEVEHGKDSVIVTAVAYDGWHFIGWSDGVTDPERQDLNVLDNIFVTALFDEVNYDQEEENFDEDLVEEESGGGGSDQDNSNTPNPNDRYEAANQVIDGETPYQDVFDDFWESAAKELLESGELTAEQRAMIEAYFEQLAAGAN